MSTAKTVRRPEVSVAQYLTFHLEATHKTQREIALEIGYDKANLITMFKQGLTKVPLHVAPKLAKAIGVDPVYFLRMCMREYMPDVLESIEDTIGAFPTQNETKVLKLLREVTKEEDYPVATKEQERTLREAFKTLGR